MKPHPVFHTIYFLAALLPAVGGCRSADLREAAPGAVSGIVVMSYNIRLNTSADKADAWPHRRDLVAGLIRFHEVDLLGVQEALHDQMNDLSERLPGFATVGVGRDDGRSAGEYSAIFYRTDRFDLLDEGTFWLSETPETPGSKSWDAALPRIVTWARFRDRRTGRSFYHFNTHFDHVGREARLRSARLLADRIGGRAPVILTGDFNLLPTDPPYPVLTGALRDAFRAAETEPYGPTGTFTGFDVTAETDRRIDYVFISEGVRVLRYGVLTDHLAGRNPSDHLPVLVEVLLP